MNFDNIPTELKELKQWVCWGVDKTKLKMPYNPQNLQPAKAGVPETWGSFEQAVKRVQEGKAQGVGFEFNNNGYYGIDLDKVIIKQNDSVRLTVDAQTIVAGLNSYTETSLSGTGLHIIIKASDIQLEANRKGFIEIYNHARYFTFTGDIYGKPKPIQERSEALKRIYSQYLKPTEKSREQPTAPHKSNQDYLQRGLEKDKTLLTLWNGQATHNSESEADLALMNKLAYWCNADPNQMQIAFFNSPHYAQKDEQHKKKCSRKDYLPNTIKQAIAGLTSIAEKDNESFKMKQAKNDFEANNKNTNKAKLVKASDVPYEAPRWLIAPYFQRGKGNMIQGDNGTGKTAFMCAIAAHVSTGMPLLGMVIEKPGNVLIISVEDDPPILRGRIEAAGGDLDRCHFFESPAGLTFNSPEIEDAVKQVKASMILFDPMQAFLGANIQMDKSNQTRPELAKLFEMAARNDCAVAIIAHTSKGSGLLPAVNKSLGSVDIPAAMRSIIHITKNPDNEAECIAVHVKCSNAPKGDAITYRIGDRGGVTWQGFSKMTADDLNAIVKRQEKGIPYEQEPLVQVFCQLIANRPGGGFWSYAEIKEEGMKILGFPPYSTVNDLKYKLDSSLAHEIQEREGLIITHSRKGKQNRSGVRIEQYQHPDSYQTTFSVPTE